MQPLGGAELAELAENLPLKLQLFVPLASKLAPLARLLQGKLEEYDEIRLGESPVRILAPFKVQALNSITDAQLVALLYLYSIGNDWRMSTFAEENATPEYAYRSTTRVVPWLKVE